MIQANDTYCFYGAGLLLSLLLFISPVKGQQKVLLEGQAPSYAGETITFYRYSDYITRDTTHLVTTPFDGRGNFTCKIALNQTSQIFTNLGPYKGYLYVEPGQRYRLDLPQKREKTQAQKLNPFFEGITVHIGLEEAGGGSLNYQLDRFSQVYEGIIGPNLDNVKGMVKKRDSVLRLLDTAVVSDHPFFNQYKKYTIAGLKLPLGFTPEQIEKQYFADRPVRYHNPAYMDAFSTLYSDYLMDLFSRHGNRLYWVINGVQSYHKLDSLVSRDSMLRGHPRLRELVILKSLNQAYYDRRFSKKAVSQMLKEFPQYSQNGENIQIAQKIVETSRQLSAGDQAPDFCLYDVDSNKVCLNDLKGEYIYLAFCNSKNYSCIRDYQLLESLYKRHQQHFRIIIISNNEFDSMKRYVQHHDYRFTFLHHGLQKDILQQYQVRNMPTYCFIDRKGKIAIPQAPGPSENIEKRIYQKMKADGALRRNPRR